ncbi:Sugar transporter ERD6-like 18 [Raphanus sativus]|nr:Sugar transporter ERD6-like 18 [Raphanus sativus]
MMVAVKEERSMEEGLLKLKNQNDPSDCRITACVFLSTFVAICGSFSFGVSVGYTSGAEVGMIKDMGLSMAEFSAFGSFSTLGATFGALFSGKMAIMLGRKGTMWVSDILCITGWLCIAFAKDVLWLNIGRFSSGIGLGLISYVVPVYIAENYAKTCSRHIYLFKPASSKLWTRHGLFLWEFHQLEDDGFTRCLPCFIQGIGLFFVPESPRWLAKVGTDKELENSLLRLRGRAADISTEASEIQVMTKMLESDSKSSFSDLLQRKYRHTLVVGIGLMLNTTILRNLKLPEETVRKILAGDEISFDDMSLEERKWFQRALASGGELSKMIEPCDSWWLRSSAKKINLRAHGKQLVQCVEKEDDKGATFVSEMPQIINDKFVSMVR